MEKAKIVLNQWLNAINEQNVQKALALYDVNAVLIPTFTNKILDNKQKIENYFKNLTTSQKVSITLDENSLIIIQIDQHKFLLLGIYEWIFEKNDEINKTRARFTFFIDTSKDSPIIHQHSSFVKEEIYLS